MTVVLLHPTTEQHIEQLSVHMPHALVLVGPAGSGKTHVAQYVAARILGIAADQLGNYPYLLSLRLDTAKSSAITVEQVRELQQALTLKVPADTPINRIVIIEDAHAMTAEAQNALLKTLEEPPVGTVIILTARRAEALLPTIQSRSQALVVLPADSDKLAKHYVSLGFDADKVNQALMLSGGLPGTTHALLTAEASHPMFEATNYARGILQSKQYERLLLVDGLSKQKPLVTDIVYVLMQMSRMALKRATDTAAQARWQRILEASYTASTRLERNVQTKLVLDCLMLEL